MYLSIKLIGTSIRRPFLNNGLATAVHYPPGNSLVAGLGVLRSGGI